MAGILCLDIETTGLDPRIHEITVACTYDGKEGRAYHFRKPCTPAVVGLSASEGCQSPDACSGGGAARCGACAAWHLQNAEALLRALDEAEYIGGYNIIHFDLPFVRKRLRVPDRRFSRWLGKVLDPFHVAKEGLGQWPSLSNMLQANQLPDKSGSGKDAIELVQKSRWRELEEYCMNDTVLSHRLLSLPQLRMPRSPDAYMCVDVVDGRRRLVVRFRNTGQGGFVFVGSKKGSKPG